MLSAAVCTHCLLHGAVCRHTEQSNLRAQFTFQVEKSSPASRGSWGRSITAGVLVSLIIGHY